MTLMNMFITLLIFLSAFSAFGTTGGAGAGENLIPNFGSESKQTEKPFSFDLDNMRGGFVGIIGGAAGISKDSTVNFRPFGKGNLPADEDHLVNNDCDREVAEACSSIGSSVPKDYLDFLLSYSSYKPLKSAPANRIPGATSTSNCDCIKQKVKKNQSENSFIEDKEKKRTVLNEKILKAFGHKFVNDFSSNIEDVSFFLTQTSKMFSNEEKGKAFQCNNEVAYNNKIKEVCTGKGISDQAFIQERKTKFINILSGRKISFESRLPSMTNEILSANITSELEGSTKGRVLARQSYDEARLALSKDDPTAKFINNFTTKIIHNDFFISKINESFSKDFSPVEAMLKVIQDYKEKPEFAQLGLSESEVNKFFQDNVSTENAFKFMMKVHPGFLHVMKDKRAFDNLLKEAKKSQDSVTDLLANEKNILELVLEENCNKMISDFANAVCIKDEDLVTNMDPNDLSRLVRASRPPIGNNQLLDITMDDLFVCEAKISSVNPDQKFKELANLFDTKLRSISSDYFDRELAHTKGVASVDAFSRTASYSVTKAGGEEMGLLADRGRLLKSSVSSPGVASTQVYAENVLAGRDVKLGKGSMSQDDAKRYIAGSKTNESNILGQNPNSIAQAKSGTNSDSVQENTQINQVTQDSSANNKMSTFSSPQYVSNAASSVSPTSNSSLSSDQAREELRKYIAEKNDPSKAGEAVAGLDDKSAVELNRLRSENMTLLEKNLKLESDKFEEMKKKIVKLEKKTPIVSSDVPGNNGPVDTSLPNLRQSFDSAPLSSQSSSSNSSRSIASVSGKFSTQVGTLASSGSTFQGTDNTVSPKIYPQTVGLTVDTTPGRRSDIRPQELRVEVQKLLENPNLNLSSLEEIKAKGFLYRYSAVENDQIVQKEVLIKFESLDQATRDAIELKLTRKTAKNQVSKLAVLRLLIN